MGEAYIVIDGRKIRLHSLTVSREYDALEITCIEDSTRRYVQGPSRMTVEAVALGMEEHYESIKCNACGSAEYRWNESTGRVCSYCRTPAN